MASRAQLRRPEDVAIDSAGNVPWPNTENHRILRISRAEPRTISLVYGSASCPQRGGVELSSSDSTAPTTLHRGHREPSRIARPTPVVPTSEFYDRRWNWYAGLSGERGAASVAMLDSPRDVAATRDGRTTYIADTEMVACDGSMTDGSFARSPVRSSRPTWVISRVQALAVRPRWIEPFAAISSQEDGARVSRRPCVEDRRLGRRRAGGWTTAGSMATRRLGARRHRVDPRLLGDASGIAFDPDEGIVYLSERGRQGSRASSRRSWRTVHLTIETRRSRRHRTTRARVKLRRSERLAFDPSSRTLYARGRRPHAVHAIRDRREAVRCFGHPPDPGRSGRCTDRRALSRWTQALAVSETVDLYIADTGNHRVLRISRPPDSPTVSLVLETAALLRWRGAPARTSRCAPRGRVRQLRNVFVTSTTRCVS